MPSLLLKTPQPGETLVLLPSKDRDPYVLDFDPSTVTASQDDKDLVFTHADGGRIVFQDYYANDSVPPVFLMGDQEMSAADLIPAAGTNAPSETRNATLAEFSNLDVLHGIDALGPLGFPQYSATIAAQTLTSGGAVPLAATTGVAALGGLTPTGTTTVPGTTTGTTAGTTTDTPNAPPSVGPASASVTEDTVLKVLGHLPTPTDTNPADILTFTAKSSEQGHYGTLSLNPDGTYTYVLNNSATAVQALGVGEKLTDTFTYTVNDGHGGTATNTLTVTVNGTNDIPTVGAATASVTEDTRITASGALPTPHDVDIHDVLTFTPKDNEQGHYGNLTLNPDGTYTYTLNNSASAVQALGVGEKLTDTFTYTVSDGHGGTATNTLTVTVNGTNDIPTVGAATASVTEDTQVTASGALPTPHDVDIHDSLAFFPKDNEQGQYGSLTLHTDGTYTYTLHNSDAAVQALGVGEKLTDTFTYTVSDGQGGIATNTLTVTINGTNDIPTVGAATNSVTEDLHPAASGTLPVPHDVDTHDTLTFTPKDHEQGHYGNLTLNPDGTYTYVLNNDSPTIQQLGAGQSLSETFTYTVSDGHGGTATNTLTLTINGINDPPTVGAAVNSVTEDTQLTASGVLPTPHDIDNNDTTLTFTPKDHEQGQYGNLTLNPDGTYTYVLNNDSPTVQALGVGEKLTETFTYTVNDGHGGTGTNTLTITVNGVNDIPTIGPAANSVTEDTQVTATGTLPVPHDVDAHDTLTFTPKDHEQGQYGNLTLTPDGSYTYALNNDLPAVQALGVGEKLNETFTYTVSDGHGGTVTNTLTITVNGTNDIPTIGPAANSVTEDTQLTATGTLPVPHDVDTHDTLTFTPKDHEQGQYGNLTLNPDGTYTYALNNDLPAVQALGVGEKLTETFTYTVSDGHGGTATNTLTITVNGTNDIPTIGPAANSVTEDTQITATGTLPVPHDVDTHDILTFTPKDHEQGQYGNLTLNPDGTYTYALNNDLPAVQALGVGQKLNETFTYTVSDGHGGTATNTLTITVNGTNDNPTVGAATNTVAEDSDAVVGVLPTPHDVDSNDTLLTFTPKTNEPGQYGSLMLWSNGSYKYHLDNSNPAVQALGVGEKLTETYTYTVNDNHGGTSTNTLTITITGTNDIPTVGAAAASVTEDTLTTATGTLPAPHDVDTHDVLTFTPKTNEAGHYGNLTLNPDGTYTYVLNNDSPLVQSLSQGQKALDTFTYTVNDGHGGTATNTLTITVNGTNDVPTVTPATGSINEDVAALRGVLPTPHDVDTNDLPHYETKTYEAGQYGSLTLYSNGSYVYLLNNNLPAVQALSVGDTLTEVFHTKVLDQYGASTPSTFTITINGTNDLPTVGAATNTAAEDVKLTATGVLPTPHDVDAHDVLTFTPKTNETGTYGNLTLNPDGTYTYTLNNDSPAVQGLNVGQVAKDVFTYTVNDGHGGTATNTLTINVTGANDAPTLTAGTATVIEDTQLTATGLLPGHDVDVGDVLSYTAKTVAGQYGTFTVKTDGTYTYTLNNSLPAVQQLGAGESLHEVFPVDVKDSHGATASNTFTITINGTNDVPTVGAATAAVTEDVTLTASGTLPTPHDTDIHDVLSFVPKTSEAGTYGSLTLNPDGTYTYTLNNASPQVQSLNAGQSVSDIFHYTVSDGHGGLAVNTLTVTVNGTNDIPTVAAATAAVTEDKILTAQGVLPTPHDVDAGDALHYVAATTTGHYGSLTYDANGNYVYTLDNASLAVQSLAKGQTATDSFTYTVTDSHGATTSNVMTVTVTGVNDAPTLAAVNVHAVEDSLTTVQGQLNAHDVDSGDTLTYLTKVNEPGLYGSLTMDNNGHYTYTLNNSLPVVQGLSEGDTLTETFFVVVRDQTGAPATTPFTVTIHGTNDAPVALAAGTSVTEDSVLTATGSLPAPTDVDVHDTHSYLAQDNVQGQYGVLSIHTDGTYTYTLNNSLPAVQGLTTGEHLSESFNYTVQDNHGATSTNTLTVTVNGTNDAPLTQPAVAHVTEDLQPSTSGTLPTPTDPDNFLDHVQSDTLHFVPIVDGAGIYGTLQLDSGGNYTYTLNNSLPQVQHLNTGDTLTETYNYAVQDDHGGVSLNTLTINIHGQNEPGGGSGSGSGPAFVLNLDTTEDVIIQASGQLAQLAGTDTTVQGQYGTLVVHSDGSCTYTLNNSLDAVQGLGQGESLSESFPFQSGGVSSAVQVTVHGTNDIPLPQIFTNTLQEDAHTVVAGTLRPVADADNTADGIASDVHFFALQDSMTGQYGTLHLTDNGNYVYVLNNDSTAVQGLGQGQAALDTFHYTVTDSAGAFTTGTLNITVQGTNDAPKVGDVSLSVSEDQATPLTGTLPTPTDADTGDVPVFVPETVDTAYGQVHIAGDGTYTYTLHSTLPAVQSLAVGDTLQDSAAFTVSDGHGGTATGHVNVNIQGVNDAPTVDAGVAGVTENTSLSAYGQLPTPHDVDNGDIVRFTPMDYVPGQYGSLDLRATGVYTYTLNNDMPAVQALGAGESLTDTFTYSVSDGHGGTTSSTLTVTVHGTNEAPTVDTATGGGDMYLAGGTHTPITGVLPTAQDVDVHDTHSYSLTSGQSSEQGQYGELHINSDGTYTYTPFDNSQLHGLSVGEHVTENFNFTVDDGHGGTATNTLTLTINGVNDNPLSGVTDHASVQETAASLNGTLTLPQDPDNMGGTIHDTLTFSPQNSDGQYGSLHLNSDGTYTYSVNHSLPAVQGLAQGESLADSFTTTVNDGHGGTAHTTLTVTIEGVNAPPTADSATGSVDMYAYGSAPSSLSGALPAAHDANTSDTHTYSLASSGSQTGSQTDAQGQYGSLHLNSDGTYTYTPLDNSALHGLTTGESVSENFTYQVSDGHGGTANSTLTLTITGINDSPLSGVTDHVQAGTSGTASGTLTLPQDPDNMGGTIHDTLTFSPQTSDGQYGSLQVASDGAYTYTVNSSLSAVQNLASGSSLTDSFNTTVNDGKGGSANTTVDVNIQGPTPAPVTGSSAPATASTPVVDPTADTIFGSGSTGSSSSGTGSGTGTGSSSSGTGTSSGTDSGTPATPPVDTTTDLQAAVLL